MSSTLGRKTPSLAGSRQSVYSHGTVRTSATASRSRRGPTSSRGGAATPWYKRPLLRHAFYTDLQRGSWHIGFYSLFLSAFTMATSGFDLYCLHEAAPGSEHTGYYIISFDFVYVGNPHVRNLLVLAAAVSLMLAAALLVTSVMLLDALRKEQEPAFVGWLWTMGLFTLWRILSWLYGSVVNDMIFAYNIIMFIAWLVFNVLNPLAFACIYSLYLELDDLTKIQDLAKLKMDTMSSLPASRAASAYGSRPTSPYVNRDTWGRRDQPIYGQSQYSGQYGQTQPPQQQQYQYGQPQQQQYNQGQQQQQYEPQYNSTSISMDV